MVIGYWLGLDAQKNKISDKTRIELATQALKNLANSEDGWKLGALTDIADILLTDIEKSELRSFKKFVVSLLKSEQNENSRRFLFLSRKLPGLPGFDTKQFKQEIFQQAFHLLQVTRHPDTAERYAQAIAGLKDELETRDLFETLRIPVCVEECETHILSALNGKWQTHGESFSILLAKARERGIFPRQLPVRPNRKDTLEKEVSPISAPKLPTKPLLQGRGFQPRRFKPEEVPFGTRVIHTPFGDRLVPIQ